MENKDYSVTIAIDQTPMEAFNAINNIAGWWTDSLTGESTKMNDEFAVQFWDVHYSKQRLTEVIPGKKVIWLVTDSQLNFLEDKQEWNGTTISFDIAEKDGKTEVTFTHHGLVPQIQCYKDCSNAWGGYITKSLYDYITTGTGQPTLKATM